MKTLIRFTIVAALLTGVSAYGKKDKVKKNCPDKNEVLEILKEAGSPHYVKKTRAREVGSSKIKSGRDMTYYHVFDVYVKDRDIDIEENRAVIFDNDQKYMGYYPLSGGSEVEDVEDGAFLVSTEDSGGGEGGGSSAEVVPLPYGKLKRIVNIGGVSVQFVAAPKPKIEEGEEAAEAEAVSLEKVDTGPEYRTWTITRAGKQLAVRAQFVEVDGNKVYLRSEAQGIVAPFKTYELSKADLDYIKEQTEKK